MLSVTSTTSAGFGLALVLSLLAPTPSVAAPPDTPHLASGVVVDGSGHPVEGARVTARVEHRVRLPTPGSVGTVLDVTTTDGGGAFELDAELTAPATRNPDGSVPVEITVGTPEVVRFYRFNALPPDAAASAWLWSPAAEDVGAHPGGQTTTARGSMSASSVADLRLTLDPLEPVIASTAPAGDASDPSDAAVQRSDEVMFAQSPNAGARGAEGSEGVTPGARTVREMGRVEAEYAERLTRCSNQGEIDWLDTSKTKDRNVPIHFSHIANNTKTRFKWQTTRETTMSIAYAGVGANYAGGLAYSQHNDYSAGLSKTIGDKHHSNVTTQWKTEWRYRKQRQWCFNAGYPYYTGKTRWIPVKWTGGTSIPHDASTFTCNVKPDRVTIHTTIWVARHTSSTWHGWFSIAGVSLSSRQHRDESHKAKYLLKKGHRGAFLCGRDDTPLEASFVEELHR